MDKHYNVILVKFTGDIVHFVTDKPMQDVTSQDKGYSVQVVDSDGKLHHGWNVIIFEGDFMELDAKKQLVSHSGDSYL